MENQQEQEPMETEQDPSTAIDNQSAEQDSTSAPNVASEAETDSPSYDSLIAMFKEAHETANRGSEAPETAPSEPPAQARQADRSEQAQEVTPDALRIQQKVEYLEHYVQEGMRREASAAVDNAVKSIKEAAPQLGFLEDRMIRGILVQEYQDDPSFKLAFDNRQLDPSLWNKIIRAKGKQLGASVKGLPDSQATQGREALRASVNTNSATGGTRQYTEADINAMSDAQFRKILSSGGFS